MKIEDIWSCSEEQDYGQYDALAYLVLVWCQLTRKGQGKKGESPNYLGLLQASDPSSDHKNENASTWLRRFTMRYNQQHYPDQTRQRSLALIHSFLFSLDDKELKQRLGTDSSVRAWERAQNIASRIYDLRWALEYINLPEGFKSDYEPRDFESPTAPLALGVIASRLFQLSRADFEGDFERFLLGENNDDNSVSFSCFRWDAANANEVAHTRLFIYRPTDGLPFTLFRNIAGEKHDNSRDTHGVAIPIGKNRTAFVGRVRVGRNESFIKCFIVGRLSQSNQLASGLTLTRGLEQSSIYLNSKLVIVRDSPEIDVPGFLDKEIEVEARPSLAGKDDTRLANLIEASSDITFQAPGMPIPSTVTGAEVAKEVMDRLTHAASTEKELYNELRKDIRNENTREKLETLFIRLTRKAIRIDD